jgi:hypothetical protein
MLIALVVMLAAPLIIGHYTLAPAASAHTVTASAQ